MVLNYCSKTTCPDVFNNQINNVNNEKDILKIKKFRII